MVKSFIHILKQRKTASQMTNSGMQLMNFNTKALSTLNIKARGAESPPMVRVTYQNTGLMTDGKITEQMISDHLGNRGKRTSEKAGDGLPITARKNNYRYEKTYTLGLNVYGKTY